MGCSNTNFLFSRREKVVKKTRVKIYCAFKNPACKYAKNRSPEGAECTYEGLCEYQVVEV